MKNKASLLITVVVGLIVVMGCKQLSQIGKNAIANSKSPLPTRNAPSRTFTSEGKEWKSYDLAEMDMKIDLPGEPSDKTPPLPESYKPIVSGLHGKALDDHDFSVGVVELVLTGKKKLTIKEFADTSMAAFKRQLLDLKYTLDVRSASKAMLDGTFSKSGISFALRGCIVYKKENPSSAWAIVTFNGKDNTDAFDAGTRALNSVAFKVSPETCK